MPDLGSLLRVVVSLGLVLALLWIAARTLQKGRVRAAGGVDVDVLARLPLAQKSSLAVVRLGDQALVLGVTESRVALLCQTPVADIAEVAAAAVAPEAARAAVPADGVPASRGAARPAARPPPGAGAAPAPPTRGQGG